MTQRRSLWRLAAACVLMALAAAGCFQEVGDNPQSTQISQFIPTATSTDTPIPSPTDYPTELPITEVAQLAVTDTETPTPTLTLTETPTPTLGAVDQPISDIVDGTKVAQGQDDEFVLTATQYVLEITQTESFSETQTAVFLGIGATETPIPFFTPTPDQGIPAFFTATPFGNTQPINPGGVCIHEVRVGDTMFHLSMLYGVSVADLASANGITNPQLILVGQKVNIPGCGTTGVYPPATSMPTQAFDSSAQFGTGGSTLGPVVQVQTSDGQIVQGQLVNSGQGGGTTFAGTTHVVQQYETLFQISQQYGVSVTSIAAANGIANINRIIMGDTLVIPAQ